MGAASASAGFGVSEVARCSNSGLYASRLCCTHWERVTGRMVTPRPLTDGVSPLAAATCSSATRASCSRVMRSMGSTFGSDWPPLAMESASCPAASQLTGPCFDSILARSPKKGMPLKGSSPNGPGSLTRAS